MAACGPPACATERLINNTCFGSAGTTPAACGCLVCSLNAKNSTYLSPHVRSSSEYKIHCQAASWTAVASLHSAARYRTISSWPRHELKLYALYHLRCHLHRIVALTTSTSTQATNWRAPANREVVFLSNVACGKPGNVKPSHRVTFCSREDKSAACV